LADQPGIWVKTRTLERDEQQSRPTFTDTDEGTLAVDTTRELNRVSAPAGRARRGQGVRVFISYATRDTRDCDQLKMRLKILHNLGLVESWEQRDLLPGVEWDKAIRQRLEEAELVILLWSEDFEASDYIQDVELQRALTRAREGRTRIVSIILKPSGWDRTEAALYQVLPTKAKPVSRHRNHCEAWHSIRVGLQKLVEEMTASHAIPAHRR
jgi:hypothetical protein